MSVIEKLTAQACLSISDPNLVLCYAKDKSEHGGGYKFWDTATSYKKSDSLRLGASGLRVVLRMIIARYVLHTT